MKRHLQKSRFTGIQIVIAAFASFLFSFCSSAPSGSPPPEEKESIVRVQTIAAGEKAVTDYALAAAMVLDEDRLLMEAEFKKLVKSERRQDYPSDAVFANFREVKLGSMASGILYRSCHPALEDARSPYAARLAEQARVGSIIDLADSPEEMALKASIIPWYQSFITQGNSIAAVMDSDYDSQYNRAKIQEVLRFMLSHKKPFLLHCVDGSSRSAFIVMVLAALMNAGREEIIGDYMQSYVNYYGFDKTEDRYRLISYSGEDMIALIRGEASQVALSLRRSPVEDTGPASGLRERAESYLQEKIQMRPGEIDSLRRLLAGQQP
ncbi:MAG: tyrosine-protein phosphatase [Treponema sp.]|jgi:protein tyrosine/serine phosphatase|nr:tyrosine-protein phosphatase [Treponema sp.]